MISLSDFKPYYESKSHGIYALFLKEGSSLSPFFSEKWCGKIEAQMKKYNCPNLLYIGIAKDKTLKRRTKYDHKTGRIRYSTLRYTISYCAGMQLYGCKGYTISEKRKISSKDRAKLTDWLLNNTYFKIIETDDCEKREKEYLEKYNPPLNIEDCPDSIIKNGERGKKYIELPPDEFDKL